jgi:hypothetical protein
MTSCDQNKMDFHRMVTYILISIPWLPLPLPQLMRRSWKESYLSNLLMILHGFASIAALALSFKVSYPLGGSQRNGVVVVAGKPLTSCGQEPRPAKE